VLLQPDQQISASGVRKCIPAAAVQNHCGPNEPEHERQRLARFLCVTHSRLSEHKGEKRRIKKPLLFNGSPCPLEHSHQAVL